MKKRLKTWPNVFAETWHGRKVHETRTDDRAFALGDTLELAEWIPGIAEEGEFTGREIDALVTHVTRGPEWGIPAGKVVMSILVVACRTAPGLGVSLGDGHVPLVARALVPWAAGIGATKGREVALKEAAALVREAQRHSSQVAGYTGPLVVGDLEDLAERIEGLAKA